MGYADEDDEINILKWDVLCLSVLQQNVFTNESQKCKEQGDTDHRKRSTDGQVL